MAVVNTTPDSFFDGGQFTTEDSIRRRIDACLEQGADVIDVGAESTRPGAAPVSASEQWERARLAVEYAVEKGAFVSIDTTSPQVARRALEAGARVVNDVSCLTDPELASVTAHADADLVLMHSRGSMVDMAGFSQYAPEAYDDIVEEVGAEWCRARDRATDRGLGRERIWFDPGFGFHKNAEQSAQLMRRFSELGKFGAPLVAGTSRKSFLGVLDDSPPDDRLGATIASCLLAIQAGARLVRVHDVHDVRQALLALAAFSPRSTPSPPPPPAGPLRGSTSDRASAKEATGA